MKRIIVSLWILFMVLSMSGCSEMDADQDGTVYKIYYLNSAMTKLAPQDFVTKTTDKTQLIEELLYQFVHVPKDLDSQAALSDKVTLQSYKQEDVVLYLYFDAGYSSPSNMNAAREILLRAALTKTLTQIEGIDFININVGDQPLMDKEGNPVGMLAGSDFVDSVGDVNGYEKTELTLFFANETGEKLVEEKRAVVRNINTSLEKLIVEELIKGPEKAGSYPTLPKETRLLNISVNENVCYLNFDSAFTANTLEIKEYIPIYSIVNSLAELTTVNKIQIMINGSADVMFRDILSLNTLFERNLDLGETAAQ